MTHFQETQRFHQPWLIGLFALGALPLLWELTVRPGPAMVAAVLGVGALVVWLIGLVELETRVDDEALAVKFHWLWPEKRYGFGEIERAEARRYRPLWEYGGYGVRFGWLGRRRAFNVSGNWGVELTLGDGKRVMIGSQRADDLERALEGMISGGGRR